MMFYRLAAHLFAPAAALSVFVSCGATPSRAASLPVAHWLAPVSGQWFDGSNWSTAPAYPVNGAYDAAIDASGAPYTVSLDKFQAASVGNLTLAADATLQVSATRLDVYSLDAGSVSAIDGAGTLVLASSMLGMGNSPLVVGPDVTIRGGGTSQITTNNIFTNQGTVLADGPGRILVTGNGWRNQGLIKAVNGGTFDLGGTTPVGGLGAFDSSGGIVQKRGTLLNTANNLLLDGPGNVLTLVGTISGGAVTSQNGAMLKVATTESPVLDNVYVNSDVAINSNGFLQIVGTTAFAPGRKIVTAGTSGKVNFPSTFAGEIVATAGGSLSQNGTLTLSYGPDVTVRAAGGGVSIGANGPTFSNTNNGRFISEAAGKTFWIYGDSLTFTNNGTLDVSAGTFRVSVKSFLHNGAIDVTGGTFETDVAGYANKGIVLAGANATLNLSDSGTVVAGFVDTSAHPAGFTWSAGTLRITGAGSNFGGALTVPEGGTLAGGGTINDAVVVSPGGTVAPGASPAILSTGSISFAAGSTLSAELNGTLAGSGYDQLSVTGTVALEDDALLDLSLGYAPDLNDAFTLIKNDGSDAITGAFLGLPEGATFTTTDPLARTDTFRISYAGGDGNDVVVQAVAVPEPTTPVAVLAAMAISLRGLARRRRPRANCGSTSPDSQRLKSP